MMEPTDYTTRQRAAFVRAYRYEKTAAGCDAADMTTGGKVRIAKCRGGSVKKALDARGRPVAVKAVKGDDALRANEREVAMHRQVNSRYIVGLRDVFMATKTKGDNTYDKLYMVLDYESQTLSQACRNGVRFDEDHLRKVVRCLVAGIADCHRQGIVHNDLLPCNILLTPEGAKLIDLGDACFVKDGGDAQKDVRAILNVCCDLLNDIDDLSASGKRFLDLGKREHVSLRTLFWHSWLRTSSNTPALLDTFHAWTDWLMRGPTPLVEAYESMV